MLGSVLFWLLKYSSDYNKVPGLVKSHSVIEEGHRQEKMQKCPVWGGREVLLTNEVQGRKAQAWWPRRDLLTSARGLKKVKVWPCGCLKGRMFQE